MDPAPGPHRPRLLARPGAHAALLLAVAALAAAVRLSTWPWVFGGDGVRIVGDGDVLYHLRQACRLVEGGLAAVRALAAGDDPDLGEVLREPGGEGEVEAEEVEAALLGPDTGGGAVYSRVHESHG